MNVILVAVDTLRRDHLGCYGSKTVLTPSMDRLAEESVVFDQFYSGSFPTLPCRAELFTGRFIWTYLTWGPLPEREVTLAETMGGAGYNCALIFDNLHLGKPRHGYDRGFHTRIYVRGQLYDPYVRSSASGVGRADPVRVPGTQRAAPTDVSYPCDPAKLGKLPELAQHLRNASLRRTEGDYYAPQVFTQAIRWLEEHGSRSPFFLHVDCFDPHEPWDPPQAYSELYDPGYQGAEIIQPIYGRADRYSPEELRHIRALYAGEATMVDRWFGKFLDAVDALGLRDDTAVIFMSDHGILLGEHALIGKMGRRDKDLHGWPTYPESSHVPLMVRAPGLKPGRRSAFCHPADLMPTALELAGVPVPGTVRARSLKRVLEGQEERVRDCAVSAWPLAGVSKFRPSVLRTPEWALYFWRSGMEPELYHRPSDPGEEVNVYHQHRAVARDLHRRYVRFLQEQETPPHNYWPRRIWNPLPPRGKPDRPRYD